MTKIMRAAGVLFLAACTARGTVTVGGNCTIDESCTTGVCMRQMKTQSGVAWQGGYCSGMCEATPCPDGRCVALADGRRYCTSECSGNGDCRSGYVCSTAVAACLPDCRLGWSCGSVLSCDQGTGECLIPASVQPTAPLGSPCELNAQCQSGLCIPPQAPGWLAGSCTQDCGNADCPAGSVCMRFVTGDARCLVSCTAAGDCRSGYICDTDIGGCLPDCRRGWACLLGQRCDGATGMCTDVAVPDAGINTVTRTAIATDTAQPVTSTLTGSRTNTGAGTGSGAGAGSGFHGGTSTGRGMPASPLVSRALSAASTSTATSWGTGIGISTATVVESR